MKENHKFRILKDGTIETIYDDGLVALSEEMGAELSQVCRASTVEYEVIGERKGWVVRAAHNPKLALRITPRMGLHVSTEGEERVFNTREEALKHEVAFFWQLLPKGRTHAS